MSSLHVASLALRTISLEASKHPVDIILKLHQVHTIQTCLPHNFLSPPASKALLAFMSYNCSARDLYFSSCGIFKAVVLFSLETHLLEWTSLGTDWRWFHVRCDIIKQGGGKSPYGKHTKWHTNKSSWIPGAKQQGGDRGASQFLKFWTFSIMPSCHI